jgi:hypothetical protein
LPDRRQGADAVKQDVAGGSGDAQQVLLLLAGSRGRLRLFLWPNMDLNRAGPFLLQLGAELRKLQLSSVEPSVQGLDQRVAVVGLGSDGFWLDLGLRLGLRPGTRLLQRLDSDSRRRRLLDRLGDRRRFHLKRGGLRDVRCFLDGLDRDGLRLGRYGLDNRRVELDRLGNGLCGLGNGGRFGLSRRGLGQGRCFVDGLESDGLRLGRDGLGNRRVELDRLGNGL